MATPRSVALTNGSRIQVKRRVPSAAFRWPAAREDENLSTLRHVEALHERRLRVL